MTPLERHIAATARLISPVGILSCQTSVTHAHARYRNVGRCSITITKTAVLTDVSAKSKEMQIFERAHWCGSRLFIKDGLRASCQSPSNGLNRNSSPFTKLWMPWKRSSWSHNSCEINTRKASHFRDLNRRAAARTKSYKRYMHQALAHARNVASDRAFAPQQEDIQCIGLVRSAIVLAVSTTPILCGAI